MPQPASYIINRISSVVSPYTDCSSMPEHVPLSMDLEPGFGVNSDIREHKTAQFFHCAFRASAVLVYLFGNLFSSGFVVLFVACVLLLAFDFWTVKNITGRLLVGLRWWSEVKDDGSNVWIFESKSANRQVHPRDAQVFWTALYVTPIVWIVFAIGAVFSFNFDWLLVVLVALILCTANLIGYWKCEKDAKKKIQSFIAQTL